MFCPACGQETPEKTSFCRYCGHFLNLAVAAPHIPGTAACSPAIVNYAGFWLRLVAFVIDAIFIYIIVRGAETVAAYIGGVDDIRGGITYGGTFMIHYSIIGTVTYWLYWSLMESSSYQATLGKMALGLRVTDLHGERLHWDRATGRFFVKFVGYAIILGIGFMMAGWPALFYIMVATLVVLISCVGFMMAAWTEKKQALHDLLAGTLVVKNQGHGDNPLKQLLEGFQ